MLKRYVGAIGASLVVTAALILFMQQMITNGEFEITPRSVVRLEIPNMALTPPAPRPVRKPPPPPIEVEVQPTVPAISDPVPSHIRTVMALRPPQGPVSIERPVFARDGYQTQHGDGDDPGNMLPVMRAAPMYPHAAELRELEGSVLVEFTVTPTGTVEDVQVIESTHPIFNKSAIDAASRFRYQPRLVDGAAIAVAGVRTEFDFQLTN